jgi:hypothetical protein
MTGGVEGVVHFDDATKWSFYARNEFAARDTILLYRAT